MKFFLNTTADNFEGLHDVDTDKMTEADYQEVAEEIAFESFYYSLREVPTWDGEENLESARKWLKKVKQAMRMTLSNVNPEEDLIACDGATFAMLVRDFAVEYSTEVLDFYETGAYAEVAAIIQKIL